MIIFPAIDIMDGKPVRLLRGDFATAEQVAEDVLNTAKQFARVGCTVTALHRTGMGALELDPTLAPGDCRALTPAEVALLAKGTVQ